MRNNIRSSLIALAFALSSNIAAAQNPAPGTYGILTGDPNNKPVVTLDKTGKKKCHNCGHVTQIKKVEEKAKGSGLGAIGGAIGGGVLGHQVGKGHGKDVATVAGAVGGALAGNEIESRIKDAKVHWDVVVVMDDKSAKELRFPDEPIFASGDRVVLIYNK